MTEEVKEGWKKVRLWEVCEKVNYGYTASAEYKQVGPKFLRITDIVSEIIDWGEVPYCQIDEKNISKFLLKEGDIVIARTGATVGYAKYIKRGIPTAVFASYLVRIRLKKECNARYIGFLIESDDYKRFIKANISGAAQPQANAQILTSYPTLLPPLPNQRKIAAILSAYDDLIENNTRRIHILEEMAQTIYKEWFVKFCFPGYEKVKMVDSDLGPIPEEWEVKRLGDVVETLGGGTPSTKNSSYWEKGDIIWFTPTDITSNKKVFIRESEKKITPLGLQKSSAKLFPAYCVMMTSRATIGEIAINTKPACTNQGFIICIPSVQLSAYYIYFWITENKEKIISLAGGATYREINKSTFRGLPILIPCDELIHLYDSLVKPIFSQIENLQSAIENLKETRDLLLPKLISGEIDVDDQEIEYER